jgi:hypothetical protein
MEVQLQTSRSARFTAPGRSPVPTAGEAVLAQSRYGRVCCECSPNVSHFVPFSSSQHAPQVDLKQKADVRVWPPQTQVKLWALIMGQPYFLWRNAMHYFPLVHVHTCHVTVSSASSHWVTISFKPRTAVPATYSHLQQQSCCRQEPTYVQQLRSSVWCFKMSLCSPWTQYTCTETCCRSPFNVCTD